MTTLTGKSKKLVNVKSKNSNRLKKPRKDIKKISGSRKIGKSDELTELTETWDEDLCE
jgi:hypothetical protein